MEDRELLTHIAEGLYQVAMENQVHGLYRKNLAFFDELLIEKPDFAKFLNSPFIPLETKIKFLEKLFGKALTPEVLAFMRILIRNKVIGYFHEIRKEYDRLSDEAANVIEGLVYTPFKLTKTEVARLSKTFARKTGKDVVLEVIEDKNLIAGLKVVLDGTVYEYSIDRSLTKLQDKLAYGKA